MSTEPLPPGFDPEAPGFQLLRSALNWAAERHQHRIDGLEHLPEGPCLLVVNHSLATYDILLLMMRIWEHSGRLPRGLGERRIFQFGWLGRLASVLGGVQGSPEAADELLGAGCIVLVAPGGMLEAIRPRDERYGLRWEGRKGFVRAAIRTQVPVVLAACPRADELFDIYPNEITDWIYRELRWPVPLFKGLGWTPIPKPVTLIHRLAAPITPPPPPSAEDEEAVVDAFHTQVIESMERLMRETLEAD